LRGFDDEVKRRCVDCHEEIIIERSIAVINAVAFFMWRRRIEHVGPVGAGAAMKLAINLPLIVLWQAFGEAVALTKPLGIDPARLVETFFDTSGAATVLKNRGAAVAKALAGEDTGPAAFDLDAMRKDLRTMLEEGKSLGVELPTTARVLEAFDRAAHAGHGGIDGVRIPAWVSRAAGSRAGPAYTRPRQRR